MASADRANATQDNSRIRAEDSQRQLGLPTASAVVIASMVGVGVFSTLSFQVHSLSSPFSILVLWIVGALVALLGALCYAELGAALPRSGGEYHLLGRIFHPGVGFAAGFVSMFAGFAAPIAVAAMAFAAYMGKVSHWADAHRTLVATIVVCVITAVHMRTVRLGARFQVIATWLKIALMLLLVAAAVSAPGLPAAKFAPQASDWNLIFSSGFAISLVYVSYAYSGWNAAVYIAGETREPQRTLPKALALSTLGVGLLYVLVNYAFLRVVPFSEMLQVNPFGEGDAGMVEKELAVGFLAGKHLFAEQGALILGLLIALCLISTISAMVFTGPRVLSTMAEDLASLRSLQNSPGQSPRISLSVQALVVIALIASSSFETILKYIGITLSAFTCLTVIGLIKLRISEPDLSRPFRCPAYPIVPIVFLAINAWMLYFLGKQDLTPLLASIATVVVAFALYSLSTRKSVGSQA